MIEILNICKSFNKIRAVDDISCKFPESGLVVLFGDSGSGKTTLLNLLGGLDDCDYGSINIDGSIISSYNYAHWTKLRRRKIDYIFQNNNLLNHLSVYENLLFVFRIRGFSYAINTDELIDNIIRSVGLLRFKNKLISQLSGGEQQRVAIARVLIGNSKIILADEPTGSLDSKSAIQVMDILKKLSESKLIILVTHDIKIARAYSDRIIHLQKGKIVNDYLNDSNIDCIYSSDTILHLKDYKNTKYIIEENKIVNIYFEGVMTDKDIEINLIVKNDLLYVDVKSSLLNNVNYLDVDSDVCMMNDHSQTSIISENSIVDDDLFITINRTIVSSQRNSLISIRYILREMLRFINNSILQRYVYCMVFIGCGFLISLCLGYIGKTMIVDELKFANNPIDFVAIELEDDDDKEEIFREIIMLKETHVIDGYSLNHSNSLSTVELLTYQYQQNNDNRYQIKQYASIELISGNDILFGRMPSNSHELVIDKLLADVLIADLSLVTIDSYNDVLNMYINTSDYNNISDDTTINVVGIVDKSALSLYGSDYFISLCDAAYISRTAPMFLPYDQYHDQLSIIAGDEPNNDNQVIVEYDINNPMHVMLMSGEIDSFLIDYSYDQYKYSVVGLYTSFPGDHNEIIYGNMTTVNTINNSFKNIEMRNNYYVYGDDKVEIIKQLTNNGYDVFDQYNLLKNTYMYEKNMSFKYVVLFCLFLFFITTICIYMSIKSIFIQTSHDVGVYKALGVNRFQLWKFFIFQVLMLILPFIIFGFLSTTIVMWYIQSIIGETESILVFSITNTVFGGLCILVLCLAIGSLSVFSLLIKKPVTLLMTHDI